MTSIHDRAIGTLVGVTIGDCVGAPFEFKGAFPARRLNIDRPSVFGHPAGCGTDDTETTRAVAAAYLAEGPEEELVARVGAGLLRWLDTRPRDVGSTTSSGLRELQRHGNPHRSGNKTSEANGSLMRCAASAIVRGPADERLTTEVSQISAITHASPVCVDACVSYVRVVSALIEGATVEQAVEAARPSTPAIKDALEVARTVDDLNHVPCRGMGHVVYAFTLALWAALKASTFEEGLTAVVCAGGDTDTNGAIAGAILGARFGFDAIPTRWTSALIDLGPTVTQATGLVALRKQSPKNPVTDY
jgi:ADP-ribosyl-[dinitrogen reductase] hydrolase